jgi:hypothetical protein
MGRSGTSAVAGMFTRAGFFPGRDADLIPATAANPRGHFENLDIWRLNELILERLSGSWFDFPDAATQTGAQSWASPLLRAQLEELVERANGAPVVLKDPRIGVMMPLWGPLPAGRLHPVLVVRDPTEIARSLRARDQTPIAFGLAAWELHLTELLGHLQGRLVTVVPCAWLLVDRRNPVATVVAAANHIEPGLRRALRDSSAPEALVPMLRHNRSGVEDHVECLTGRQHELWRLLAQLAPGDQMLDIPIDLRAPRRRARETVRDETRGVALVADLAAARAALDSGAGQVAGEPALA